MTTTDPKTTNQDKGIRTRVSEAVYPKDILSELTLITSPPDVKGAWLWCLFVMWHEGTDRVSGTYDEMGRLWGCNEADAERLTNEINERKICTVTLCHKMSRPHVTLMSRRLNRKMKAQEQARIRKKRQRDRDCHAKVTPHVTPEYMAPSSSSSSSSSVSKVNTPKKEKTPRRVTSPFGEFKKVKLTVEEYAKLTGKHGEKKANAGIEELDAWLESTGRRRSNHYACLKDNSWVWEKIGAKGGKGHPKLNNQFRSDDPSDLLEQANF